MSYISLSVILVLILNYFFKKFNILLDKKTLIHKKYTSKEIVPLTGGVVIFLNLLIFDLDSKIKIFSTLIFFLGIFSDLSIISSALKRFTLQFIIIISFLFLFKLKILSTRIFFIDYLLVNNFFSFFFTAFCLLILINGTNFLDGLNTLVCGYYILVISIILLILSRNKIIYEFVDLYNLLFILIAVYVFNFFSKLYLGDSGSYILSFIIGIALIKIANTNLNISPIFIVLLLWYPAFENLFSILRKLFYKEKPSQPDNLHLHQLLFSYLNKKKNNNKFLNTISANLINLYNFLVFYFGSYFFYDGKYLTFLITLNILLYVSLYYFLKKFKKIIK
jgi:UDP-N-acetylmuramyl pentapeptide phosphotransferase/UDP-N-acetylglucosamine-1-phosphate transferase